MNRETLDELLYELYGETQEGLYSFDEYVDQVIKIVREHLEDQTED
jgi:hypothetical protein